MHLRGEISFPVLEGEGLRQKDCEITSEPRSIQVVSLVVEVDTERISVKSALGNAM